jgi:hypothetical protein
MSARRLFLLGLAVTAVLLLIFFSIRRVEIKRAAYQRQLCAGVLNDIRMAKSFAEEELGLTNGDIVPENVLSKYLDRREHVCPCGGRYLINPVGANPQCTFTGVYHTWSLDWKTLRVQRQTWRHEY